MVKSSDHLVVMVKVINSVGSGVNIISSFSSHPAFVGQKSPVTILQVYLRVSSDDGVRSVRGFVALGSAVQEVDALVVGLQVAEHKSQVALSSRD